MVGVSPKGRPSFVQAAVPDRKNFGVFCVIFLVLLSCFLVSLLGFLEFFGGFFFGFLICKKETKRT